MVGFVFEEGWLFLHQAVFDSVLDRPAAEKSKKIIGWGDGSSSKTNFCFCFFAPSCDRLRRSCMVFFIEIGSPTRFASSTRVFFGGVGGNYLE